MKILMLLALLLSSGLMACSQDINAKHTPALVKNALLAKFPDAVDVEWEKKRNRYEADFSVAYTEYTALIDASGKIVMYKQEVPLTELPANLATTIRKNFAGYTVEELEKIQKSDQVFYQVELEKNTRELKRVFTSNGEATSALKYWH